VTLGGRDVTNGSKRIKRMRAYGEYSRGEKGIVSFPIKKRRIFRRKAGKDVGRGGA